MVVMSQSEPKHRTQPQEIKVRLRSFICRGRLVMAVGWGAIVNGVSSQEWHEV